MNQRPLKPASRGLSVATGGSQPCPTDFEQCKESGLRLAAGMSERPLGGRRFSNAEEDQYEAAKAELRRRYRNRGPPSS